MLTGETNDTDLDGINGTGSLRGNQGAGGRDSFRRPGMTRTGGHGVPGCQVQTYSQDSQRKSKPFLARVMSSRNAPQRGHCAIKVDAR